MASIVSIMVMYLYIKILYGINVESGEATRSDMSGVTTTVTNTATTTTPMTPGIEMQDKLSVVSTSTTGDNGEISEERKLTTTMKQSISVTLEQAQLKMVRNITKNTILGLFGLLSTVVINIKTSIEWIADLRTDATMWRCMASFDGAVNIIVMYLIFGWTASQYKKICFYCHTGMQKCCIRATKKSIIRKDQVENEISEYID